MTVLGEVFNVTTAWEYAADAPLVGMQYGRESGTVLVWDERHSLYHVDRNGKRLGRWVCPHEILSAALADDGRAAAAVTSQGRIVRLDPLLLVRRDEAAPPEARVVALDAQGWYTAVASASRECYLLDANGKRLAQFNTQRPLAHLVFLDEHPLLVGATDDGTISAFDLSGRVVWQRPTAYRVQSLVASGSGEWILAPSMQHGLARLRYDGRRHTVWPFADGIERAGVSEDGSLVLAALSSGRVELLDERQAVRWSTLKGEPAVGAALDPLARRGWLALSSGKLICLEIRRELR